MECFPVRYDSRVVIYDRRAFIRLATGERKRCNLFAELFSIPLLQPLLLGNSVNFFRLVA